jgi:glycosyltransferase involved in cell wall biosynthesis
VTPFPPRLDVQHGGRVVAQLILHLAEHYDIALVCGRTPDQDPVGPDVAAACQVVEEVPARPPGPLGPAWRHRRRVLAGIVTGRPTNTLVVSPELPGVVRAVADRFRPHVVQVEHDQIAHAACELDRSAVHVLVCHEPGMLSSQDQSRRTQGRQHLAHRLETRMWRRFYRRNLPCYDGVVCFSEHDQALMERYAHGLPMHVVPLGLDVPEQPLDPVGRADGPVCFIGNYRHPPNVDAALRLMRSIMPAVRLRHPGRELTIVGTRPRDEMLAAAGPLDTVTGRVERVEPYQDEAPVIALPLRMGGGMRVKFLEAMAAGKAVVASPLAAVGLDLTSGDQVVLAETDAEFAEAIIHLLDDEEERRALALRARAWTLEHATWGPRVAAYVALHDELRRGASGRN